MCGLNSKDKLHNILYILNKSIIYGLGETDKLFFMQSAIKLHIKSNLSKFVP